MKRGLISLAQCNAATRGVYRISGVVCFAATVVAREEGVVVGYNRLPGI